MDAGYLKHASNRAELRKFGLVFAAILVLLFGLFLPWLLDHDWPAWPYITAAVFASLALVFPIGLKPVYILWMKFGYYAGWINTRLILGLAFFLMFLPIGLLFRLIGKDPMHRKLDNSVKSYRVPSHSSPRDQMERPF